jgi:hypothetical protein
VLILINVYELNINTPLNYYEINMKQVGTPFKTIKYGVQMTTFFAVMTAGFAYEAYLEGDIFAGLSSIGCLGITGLAAYNTLALELSGNYADSVSNINDLS